MKKVISRLFSFVKQLFLRLRLVVTLSIGRNRENDGTKELGVEDSKERED